MTNKEKIEAIRSKINCFGGTTITFTNNTTRTIIGFSNKPYGEGYYYLNDITADGNVIGKTNKGEVISIPLF